MKVVVGVRNILQGGNHDALVVSVFTGPLVRARLRPRAVSIRGPVRGGRRVAV